KVSYSVSRKVSRTQARLAAKSIDDPAVRDRYQPWSKGTAWTRGMPYSAHRQQDILSSAMTVGGGRRFHEPEGGVYPGRPHKSWHFLAHRTIKDREVPRWSPGVKNRSDHL